MPREIYLTNHLSADELKQKYLKSRDPVESRRWHLLWNVSLGWSIKNSAIAVGVSYTYGKKIVKKYNELGEEGVKNIKNKNRQQLGGKKPLLTEKQQDKLKKELETRPSDGGIWTGPKVARWIEKETGVEKVWNQRGWDYLKKFRYSCQSPRPKSPSASSLEQAQFIKNLPLKVKELEKRYPDAEIDLWFFDEHRVGLKPIKYLDINKALCIKKCKTLRTLTHCPFPLPHSPISQLTLFMSDYLSEKFGQKLEKGQ